MQFGTLGNRMHLAYRQWPVRTPLGISAFSADVRPGLDESTPSLPRNECVCIAAAIRILGRGYKNANGGENSR